MLFDKITRESTSLYIHSQGQRSNPHPKYFTKYFTNRTVGFLHKSGTKTSPRMSSMMVMVVTVKAEGRTLAIVEQDMRKKGKRTQVVTNGMEVQQQLNSIEFEELCLAHCRKQYWREWSRRSLFVQWKECQILSLGSTRRFGWLQVAMTTRHIRLHTILEEFEDNGCWWIMLASLRELDIILDTCSCRLERPPPR